MAVLLLAALFFSAACTGGAGSEVAGGNSASSKVAELDTAIEDFVTSGSGNLENIISILVSVKGTLVTEHYRPGGSPEKYSHVFSVTKSVMSTLVGIAVADGHIRDLDQPLRILLPSQAKRMSRQVGSITLRQLLTMSSGMPGQEALEPDPFTKNAVENFLALPLQAAPGTQFIYSDAGAELVAAVLTEAVDRPLLDYAREKLFDPMSIRTRPAYTGRESFAPSRAFNEAGFAWATTKDGIQHGCCLLKLTGRDMLKIGQLYLGIGAWNGHNIVQSAWVAQATAPSSTSDVYGYMWWLNPLPNHRSYAAIGRDGQMILVLPDLSAVVTVSSRSNPNMPLDESMIFPFINEVIIPRIS